jgi:hypothetical protein
LRTSTPLFTQVCRTLLPRTRVNEASFYPPPATAAARALLPRLVIHLVGVDLSTALAAAVDGPRTSLDLYLLGVGFVSPEERFYGGFLIVFFYQMVVVHDGCLSSVSGNFGGRFSQSRIAS